MRFHSVAEFSSYCTSVLSLSYNASNTKYSTRGVSFHQYRYNKWNKKQSTGLPFANKCPLLWISAQPKYKGKGGKNNLKEPKQSRSVWIYTRAAHMDICDKRLLESESRNNIYKQVWNPSHVTAVRLRPMWAQGTKGWGLESGSPAEEQREGVGLVGGGQGR